MIVGFEAKRAFKNRTGLGNYSRMLISGLAQQHPAVKSILYAPDLSGGYRDYFVGCANIATCQPTGLARLLPHLWRSYGVSRRLAADGVELYHGLSHELPYGIPAGVKRVVTMHDLIVWRFPHYFKAVDRLIHRLKQRHACRVADAVVAISESTKRDLMELMQVPEEKIHVIYQSCDPLFWQPIAEDKKREVRARYQLPERYVVCVGTLEERKNQRTVVEAFAQLPEEVHLVIVGRPRGRYAGEVMSAVATLGLSDRVHVLSHADFKDFPALYANAEASVYMSWYEGFGIPILESLCCDTPVVTSDVSSMPEAGGDAALYAHPDDPDTVARQLRRILEDPQLRADLVARGRRQRERFSQEKIIADLYGLYERLI